MNANGAASPDILEVGFSAPTDVGSLDAQSRAGVRVGVVTAPGHRAALTAPGPGPATRVNVVDAATQSVLDSFFAFGPDFRGGAFAGG